MRVTCFKSGVNEFRAIKANEVKILEIIMQAGLTVHHNHYCFCDKHNNLYSLSFSNLILSINFIRSNVKDIDNTKPIGYYEANYPVYESLVDLYSHIPKRRSP